MCVPVSFVFGPEMRRRVRVCNAVGKVHASGAFQSPPPKRSTLVSKRTLQDQDFNGFVTSLKFPNSILRPPPSPLGLRDLSPLKK